MEIKAYVKSDEERLFAMMREEGEEWSDYYGQPGIEKYRRALESSLTYLAYEGDLLCGYARCRDDDGFGVYVHDLLVRKACRGRDIGRKLMERACADYPQDTVYVMSDEDGYYEKLGYSRAGSIFIVKRSEAESP